MIKGLNIKQYGRKFWRLLRFITLRFIQNDGTYRAAALSFMSLLSIVPLMSVSFAILSFPVLKSSTQVLQNYIFENFVPATGKIVQRYLETFTEQASQLSVMGLAFLIITAVLLMSTIESALNQIWCVRERRQGISAFLLYWAVLTLAPVMMGLSIVISSYVLSLPFISTHTLHIGNFYLLNLTPFFLAWISFTALYIAVPNCRVCFRHGVLGGLFAALLFEFAKFAFTYYLKQYKTYQLLYGAFATVPIFFLWVYYVWTIILLGAEVSHALAAHYDRRLEGKIDGFTHAVRWLYHLWVASQNGYSMSAEQLINSDPYNYDVLPDQQIARLLEARLIRMTSHGRYVLARDLSSMKFSELIQLLPWKLPGSHQVESTDVICEVKLKSILLEMEKTNDNILQMPVQALFS